MGKSIYHDFKEIKKHARELRSTLIGSEELLWKELRNRRLSGYKFLRQHPIVYKAYYKGLNYFISDFYCKKKRQLLNLMVQSMKQLLNMMSLEILKWII